MIILQVLLVVLVTAMCFLTWMVIQELKTMNANFQSLDEAIAALQTDVANESTVVDGAVTLIEGIPALIQAAVTAALAAGATPAQLASFNALNDAIVSKASQLAAAVASAPSGTVASGKLPPGATPARV